MAVGFLQNYLVGLANSIQTELEEIDTEVILDIKEFGTDGEQKTYQTYEDFTQRVFRRLGDTNRTLTDLVHQLDQFAYSTPAEPETAKSLAKQLQETVEFLLALLREITDSRPPSAFACAHITLRDSIHTYITDLLVFIREVEETLVSPERSHRLTMNLKITRMDEFWSEFEQAWRRCVRKSGDGRDAGPGGASSRG